MAPIPGEIAEVSEIMPEEDEQPHASALLQKLIGEAPEDHFTLDWLVGHLPHNSFGVILLFLALFALVPVVSIPARLLILILVCQIILGYRKPVLPNWLMMRRLPSHHLTRLNRHAIPTLKHLEKIVRPRWPALLTAARRTTAFIALMLTVISLLAPLPLMNVPPAIVSALIALAYIEHDGVLLLIALFSAILLLAVVSAAIV